MANNDGSEKFDEVANLKTKSVSELMSLRAQFETACRKRSQESFIRYLALINVEIASRIGKKSK